MPIDKAEVIFEKLAIKVPNLKVVSMTPKEIKLFDLGYLVEPIEKFKKQITWKPGKKALEELANWMGNMDTSRIAGTIRNNKKTGKRFVIVNKNIMEKYPREGRRTVIAHEAFHAKAPGPLMFSELGAHVYGGIKSKAGLLKKFGPVDQYLHYWKTRPGYATAEHGLLGGAAYSTSKLLKGKENSDKDYIRTKIRGL